MVGGSGPEFQHCPPEGGASDGGKEKAIGPTVGRRRMSGKDLEEEDVSLPTLSRELGLSDSVSSSSHYPLTSPSLHCLSSVFPLAV